MKILMVNKFHYIKGGSETYYFSLKKKLEEEGHTVIEFSMKDSHNLPSNYEKYFVEHIDYEGNLSVKDKIRNAARIIYSGQAKRKFEQLVQDEKPDLVHLHIFQHQISPSILDIIKKYRIPTVYTAHDLKMLCLNYKMMHHGSICEECKRGNYFRCAINKCVKDSFIKSCINVAEGYIHKWKKSYDSIDMIITPSEFYKKKMIEFGVNPERITYIPNFLEEKKNDVNLSKDSKPYYLFLGRLSEEKGLFTLIKAVEHTDVPLRIAGMGPLMDNLQNYLITNNIKNIELLGFRSGQELIELISNSKAMLLPSEWYENGPYSAIEALQLGRPIIGSDIGGIPEMIKENGFLFEAGNSKDLYEKIILLDSLSQEEYELFEKNSYKIYNDNYKWEKHYSILMKVYEKALKKGL